MEYGYIRVSTREQNEQRQLIAMREFGIDEKRFIWTSSPGRTLSGGTTRKWFRN